MALAVLPSGRILAADMQRGLLSSDNDGGGWTQRVRGQVMGLAVNPRRPQQVLASGPGIAVSTDSGTSWRQVFQIAQGIGPVAYAPSEPSRAYGIGLDRRLYRSDDGGRNWSAVSS